MKKTIGFPISCKRNEQRRAIIPEDLANVNNIDYIYIEQGYGMVLGIPDSKYQNIGCHIVSREEVLAQDIICDPKVGDAEYLSSLKPGQTVFGWVHAVQNRDITDVLIDRQLTAIAWEDMFYKGRHAFWRNNEIAGEAAIMHAFLLHGVFPYDTKVCLIGKGNTARGALKILTYMGAEVTVYDKRTEVLVREDLHKYDVVVNAILWDVSRQDHIIYETDLERMKEGALIIDISCDRNGGIESSIPTSFDNPTYITNGVVHYVVDHTPSLFYKSISKAISSVVSENIDMLITNDLSDELLQSLIIKEGQIIDKRINDYQNRR